MIVSSLYFCFMNFTSHMIKNLLLLFTVFFFLFSCNNKKKDNTTFTYIGGEIINPKGDYVLIYEGDQLLDSIKLDADNHFIYKSTNLKEGLYSFSHDEFQVFYLKPLDSLMLRVNTMDFDESLSFTGDGAERNNFLMEMFLHNEEEIELMPKLYKLPPLEFEKAMDSLKTVRNNIYSDFSFSKESNNLFTEIAKASINYDYYSKKEIYITANERKKGSESYVTIPESFYSYRKNIDFGSETLRSYFPYYRFLFRYFDNVALDKNDISSYYNRNSFKHSYRKIELIDSTITNEDLKNSLIKNIAGRYLLNCNSKKDQQKMLALFMKTNTNKEHQKELKEVATSCMKLTPGHKISNQLLVTPENTYKDLQTIIVKPTVIYFWSLKSVTHLKEIHRRVNDLKTKFPEFDFIGVNTDSNFNKWNATIKKYGYTTSKEFQFNDIENAQKDLIIYSINKSIIVDEKGNIINGSTNLFSSKTEEILLSFLN